MALPTRRARLYPTPPVAPEPVTPDGIRGLAAEWRSVLQAGRLMASTPRLARLPRGDGRVVFDIPGWKSPEAFMAPVRGYLRYLGYDARPWGLGVNDGSVEDSLEVFVDRVREAWEEGDGRPVCLIGWSYGGVVARETARRVPDAVRHVFTYGTPVVGGPTYTLGASEHTREALAAAAEKQRLLDERDPIRVPITAFFSRSDHVVHWPSTIDRTSLSVEHISVGSTHLSLGIDPDVWAIIARRLASGAVADRAR